ncbi:MAG: amino acid racemase [Planctomycetes bacterium]|nr:amino acid racemase [Planctomycetota bacterium]
MARHIGIVACSAEGAALCYRTICAEAPALMGEHAHPEITMHTHPLARYMAHIRTGDWPGVAELMLSSAAKLSACGAGFAICPDNTIHQAFGLVEPRSPIPWLHIARVVAAEATRRGHARLAILGTRYLMEGPVYPDALAPAGIQAIVPDPPDRERINDIIFRELVNAVFTEESRLYLNEVMARLKARGADAAVLGCTEIPLIVRPDDCPLPTLDSTRLLARAALAHSLGESWAASTREGRRRSPPPARG